ncbi:MAG: tRNA glutamyl-Q(34) synthetase GluQRS [Myxococcaceae bacterium]
MTVHRGRFAPSPTGRIHLGNARSALLGWWWARAQGGQFLLRIEDLDRQRSRPEFLEELFRDLEYLGIDWDEPPLYQSRRQDVYDAVLEQLSGRGFLYECFCSRTEIARAASAPHGPADEGPIYPGTCLPLTRTERLERAKLRSSAVRFRPREGEVCFEDGLHGPYCQDVAREVGDFVVRRNDGVASYQLAVVVDDAASGITHVLRGDDLLSSTPRQLLLYEALVHPPPTFAHVPLILGPDGKRLAKREGAFAVTELREAGVPAERVVGLLAGWSGLDPTPRPARELVPEFDLLKVPRAPVPTTEQDIRRALEI